MIAEIQVSINSQSKQSHFRSALYFCIGHRKLISLTLPLVPLKDPPSTDSRAFRQFVFVCGNSHCLPQRSDWINSDGIFIYENCSTARNAYISVVGGPLSRLFPYQSEITLHSLFSLFFTSSQLYNTIQYNTIQYIQYILN